VTTRCEVHTRIEPIVRIIRTERVGMAGQGQWDPLRALPWIISAKLACGGRARFVTSQRQYQAWREGMKA
jgi:hypothetical protein